MSTTVGNALNDLIASSSLPLPVKKAYLDFAPQNTPTPYLTYNDNVAMVPSLSGDGKALNMNRTMQFNVWQKTDYETATLPGDVVALLNGAILHIDGISQTLKVSVASMTRLDEPEDSELIHHEITIDLTHPVGTP